jgi:hypothetical protein
MSTTFLQRVLMMLVSPLHCIGIFYRAFFLKSANNPLCGKKLSGLRTGHMSKPFKFEDIKKSTKKLKVTWNDAFMAVCSNTIAEYFEYRGDTKEKVIQTIMPFSLRERGDNELKNAISSLIFPLPIEKEFTKAQPAIAKISNYLKRSGEPFGFYYMTKVNTSLPLFVQQIINNTMIDKATCVISNIPGPRK